VGQIPTTTAIVSEDPPVASLSTAVTFIARVRPESAGPALGGDVTFTYKTTGLPAVNGTLGTAPVDANDEAQITTSAGDLPVVGVYTITATYSGDTNYTASHGSVIYDVDSPCDTGAWPDSTSGYPQVHPGSALGYYIGQSNGWWTLYTARPEGGKPGANEKFTGRIVTNAAQPTGGESGAGIMDISSTKNGPKDIVRLASSNVLTFTLYTHEALNGFTFFAGCGSKLTFNLKVGVHAAPAPVSEIFLGGNPNTTTNPTANPVVFTRSS
jgi:hypothetical protein